MCLLSGLDSQTDRWLFAGKLFSSRGGLYHLLRLGIADYWLRNSFGLRFFNRFTSNDFRAGQRLRGCGLGFGFSCFLGQALGFALTAADFARIVWCAAARRQCGCGSRCCFGFLDNWLGGWLRSYVGLHGRHLAWCNFACCNFGRLYRSLDCSFDYCRFLGSRALVSNLCNSSLLDDGCDAFGAGLDHGVIGKLDLRCGFGVGSVCG